MTYTTRRFPALLLLLFMISSQIRAEPSDVAHEEISFLKQTVRASDCVFVRNDEEYSGSEAVTHIERKHEYFEDRIHSTEDFIALAATKSEMTGKYYTVRCGSLTRKLSSWLEDALRAHRAGVD